MPIYPPIGSKLGWLRRSAGSRGENVRVLLGNTRQALSVSRGAVHSKPPVQGLRGHSKRVDASDVFVPCPRLCDADGGSVNTGADPGFWHGGSSFVHGGWG